GARPHRYIRHPGDCRVVRMTPRRRLIVVSNRGPVTFGRDASDDRIARRGGGGLVTAVDSLASRHDVTWIASALSDEDRAVAEEAGGGGPHEAARAAAPVGPRAP